jgi:hypothetical protein
MLYQRLAVYFLKAEYIIQVMNSTVKDKWGVDSSLNLSPIKAPIQYKRKPLNIYWLRTEMHVHKKLGCRRPKVLLLFQDV